ncbi:MAG: GAF domain-containing protein [Solirubrobacteraceae bacterium]|jgi:GAF domain-containing protein
MDSAGGDRASSECVESLRRIKDAQDRDVLERALSAARQELGMDAAYITTIDSGYQTIEAVVGDLEALGAAEGIKLPVEESFCMKMLEGRIPNVVPDTRAEPALRDLDVTTHIGAYVGVPVTLSDGRVHGTLCCACESPRTELGVQQLGFMRVLADMVAARLDQVQGNVSRLTERFRTRRGAV